MTMINLKNIQKDMAGRPLFTIDRLVANAGDKIGVAGTVLVNQHWPIY